MQESLADSIFGDLIYVKKYSRYSGSVFIGDAPVEVMIRAVDLDDLKESLAVAHHVWTNRDEWLERILKYIIDDLLPIKNEDWRNDDEPLCTESDFRDSLTITRVDFLPGGAFELWYNCEDIFSGHSILARCTQEEGPLQVDIAG